VHQDRHLQLLGSPIDIEIGAIAIRAPDDDHLEPTVSVFVECLDVAVTDDFGVDSR
jgi:hypothetical protein